MIFCALFINKMESTTDINENLLLAAINSAKADHGVISNRNLALKAKERCIKLEAEAARKVKFAKAAADLAKFQAGRPERHAARR